jgi:glutamate carboxypeptidase
MAPELSNDVLDIDLPVEPEAVLRVVHAHRSAYVEFVRRLAEMESPSTHPSAQHDWQAFIADALADLGFETTHLPGQDTGGCLYARPHQRPHAAPVQLLLGHGDTVWDLGTVERMPVHVSNGRLHGPGIFDMKAGLASIVFALRTLHRLGADPPVTPVVLMTSDEEIGSFESRPHIERLAARANRTYVLEPALGLQGKIKTTRKGTGDLELVVRARRTEVGNAVVLELSRLVQHLYSLNDPSRGVTVNVGTIDGRPRRDRPEGRLAVDVRVPTVEDARRVDAAIRSIEASRPDLTVYVHGGMDRDPMEATPANRCLWNRARQLGQALGLSLTEGRSGGASDGNLTSPLTATLDGLGAVGDGAHAQHEFIEIDATLDRCALLALLLLDDPVPPSVQ